MTRFPRLPTLADQRTKPLAIPKGSKIDREKKKKADDREDERQLRAWSRKVKLRDKFIDQYTGKPVRATSAPIPDRADAHHVVSRSDWAVRYDVRNGICVSARTHDLIERNVLTIAGTRWFTVNGRRYIDATHRVIFTVKNAKGMPNDPRT